MHVTTNLERRLKLQQARLRQENLPAEETQGAEGRRGGDAFRR
jgi:hypothetical protein